MQQVFEVQGMTCGHCERAVTNAIQGVDAQAQIKIDRAANRLAMALVIAALIVGSSIVMTVRGGPTLFGLPAFGFLGFFGAVVCGLWLVRAIWRSSHRRDDDSA